MLEIYGQSKPMLSHIEYDSNHGTSQGIWPRFYLQMADLGELAIGKIQFEERTKLYFDKVIPDLTNLYDIYHDLINTIEAYRTGVEIGKFFKIDDRGHSSLDRLNEIKIYNLTKDFIIRIKIALVNFVKSGVADDIDFTLSDFYFCNDQKFRERKKRYFETSDRKYLPLVNLIEKSNKDFLNQLNDIRGAIEHEMFSLPKFKLQINNNTATIEEPDLLEQKLSKKLEYFYEKVLEFIEKIMVYYLGINGESNKNGFLELHVDEVFDYPEMKWKYTFALGGIPWSFTSKKCQFD